MTQAYKEKFNACHTFLARNAKPVIRFTYPTLDASDPGCKQTNLIFPAHNINPKSCSQLHDPSSIPKTTEIDELNVIFMFISIIYCICSDQNTG